MLKNKLSYNTLIIGINPSECHEVAREIVDQLRHEKDVKVVLVDTSGSTFASYHEEENGEDCLDILQKICDTIQKRFVQAKETGRMDKTHLFVIVDNLDGLCRQKAYVKCFTTIASLGGSAHVHLIGCAQDATQKSIPALIRDNLVNVVCLRQDTSRKYHYLLDCYPGELESGYAYVSLTSRTEPQKAMISKVWDIIKEQ